MEKGKNDATALQSIDKRPVCFISAYREKYGNEGPEQSEIDWAHSILFAETLRRQYVFRHKTYIGYYQGDNSAQEVERGFAVYGYKLDDEADDPLIDFFRNIMLTLAREIHQDIILFDIPGKGAELIFVPHGRAVKQFFNLTEEQLFATYMEEKKKYSDLNLHLRKTYWRTENDSTTGGEDNDNKTKWITESVEETVPYRVNMLHGMGIDASRKKAAKDSEEYYSKFLKQEKNNK